MNILKTTLIAITALTLTAGAASAATYAWADQDAAVRDYHKNNADKVNWISEGQKVKIIGSWGNWYKIQIPGQDGWVKAKALDFSPFPNGPVNGGSFCVGDPNAKFCINASF